MRMRAICGACNVRMREDRFSSRLVVHSCMICHRVVVVGATVTEGNMFDTVMRARGYHRPV